jgi:hypothetical protein
MSFQQKLEAEKARQRAEPVKKQELAEASNVEAIEAKREPVVEHEIQEEIKKPINFNGLKARKRTRVGKLSSRSLAT